MVKSSHKAIEYFEMKIAKGEVVEHKLPHMPEFELT